MRFLVIIQYFTRVRKQLVGINFYKKANLHLVIVGVNINWLLDPNHGAIGASICSFFIYCLFYDKNVLYFEVF
ncbi:hypothetical protein [Alteribacillus sp. YIM 98480]|uniref:hypothetical protein n=1 Tax=Alteribacillus sp. YIM 98480 TaxID=2606599 RepID=UPI00131B38AB|nr:hypothetical protein [Alteribacillus sp. YIM 98480]